MSPGRARLPRSHRLVRRADFLNLNKQRGCRSRDECFVVHAQPGGAYARLGVTVARRVSLKAVTRNRIKRQIRESFRLHRHSLPAAALVVIAQPPAARQANPQLRASLQFHWERITTSCKNFQP